MNCTLLWALNRDKNDHGIKDVPTDSNMAYSINSFNKSSTDNSKGPAQGGEYEAVDDISCKLWVLANSCNDKYIQLYFAPYM